MSENVWDELGQLLATHAGQPEGDDIWNVLTDRLNLARFRPRQAVGCELQRHVTHTGEQYHILTNSAGVYLKLTPGQAFIWQTLDGQHTVRDITLAYMNRYEELAVVRVIQTLEVFLRNGFLEQPGVDAFAQLGLRLRHGSWLLQLPGKLLRRFMSTTFSVKWIDGMYHWLYRHGARSLFSLPVQVLLGAITLAGIAAFTYLLNTQHYNLFTTHASFSLGLLTLYVAMTLVALLHESGHALTCVHYGRKVRKAGVMIYMGMLAFFVDTTDIWMAPRRARIAVSWAGPYTNLLCSSALCIILSFWPNWALAEVLFKVAAMSLLLAVMNLNPLLLYDGYYILVDLLEMPNLRHRAFSFLRKNLHPSRRWLSLNRQQKILVAYGLFAALYTGIVIVIGLRALATAAYGGLHRFVGPQWSNIIFLAIGGLFILAVTTTWVQKRAH